ncbi:MAG: protein kinase [Actinomycetota bacterium]|nr:protein kinase [Actinomycetota bacterium]MDQ6946367.1 protein kinase [Actinomycetota bacterium]
MGVDQVQEQIAGRYRLIEPIGRGGSGVVWRAQDLRLQRAIAMKELLPPAAIGGADRRRLQQAVLREARAAARLQHPGAVAVYDVVEDGERQFIVMELVEAPDLSQVVALHGPLDPARTAAIGLELLEVLQAAHEAGIVHRDVKPGNVLVPSAGPCRLSDFGIASLIDDPSVTATGMVKGTPSYMSPEQATAGPLSFATDLWSLGATLYFAVEGRAPFDRGQAIATLTAIAMDGPQPFVLAGSMAAVLQPLFAKDPAARPGHEALRRSLQEVVDNGRRVNPLPASSAAPPTEVFPAAPAPQPTARPSVQPDLTEARPVVRPVADTRPEPRAAPSAPPPPPASQLLDRRLPTKTPALEVGQPRSPELAHTTRPAAARAPGPRRASGAGHRPLRLLVPVTLVGALLAGYLTLIRSGPSRSTGATLPNTSLSTTQVGKGATPTTHPPSTQAQPQPAAAPAGWKSYTDPDTGFRLAYPATWTMVRNGTLTDFRDPATGTYLRIDHQSPPASTADGPWYQLEPGFAANNPGYQRIGISRTTFHGYAAAIWEYTYQGGGQQLHAIDIGMIVGDHGFGFNFQTADTAWSQNQPLLTSLENAFQP